MIKQIADWIRREAKRRNEQAFQQGSWRAVADAIEENFKTWELLGTFQGVPVCVQRPDAYTDEEWTQWKTVGVARFSHVGEIRQPLSDELLDEHGF